jgi:hypothetical protein
MAFYLLCIRHVNGSNHRWGFADNLACSDDAEDHDDGCRSRPKDIPHSVRRRLGVSGSDAKVGVQYKSHKGRG